ncbi:hypothetical protein M5K25_008211 [Dendrobium thyrsiflorum]|uniref:Uncharacterized protein n=1 Tax=Dendrobium thyrsiflorum TaxID=117978 RepID=A0ABD0V843_DENTH
MRLKWGRHLDSARNNFSSKTTSRTENEKQKQACPTTDLLTSPASRDNNHSDYRSKQHKIPFLANPKQRQIHEQSSTEESNKEEASRPDQILVVFPYLSFFHHGLLGIHGRWVLALPLSSFLLKIPQKPQPESLGEGGSSAESTNSSFGFVVFISSWRNLSSHTSPDDPDLLKVSVDLCNPAIYG